MTDLTPGSRWLLPVTIDLKVGDYNWLTFFGGRSVCADPEEMDALIPADRITELEGEVERLKAQADNQTRIALEHWYSGIKTAVTFMHETAKLLNEPGARAAMNTAAHALALEAKRKMAA